jgi:hypothetical protein
MRCERSTTVNASIMESPSAIQRRVDESRVEIPDSNWTPLYRIGGAAALASIACIVLAVAVFLAWPPPTTILGHFTLLRQHPLIGLLDLDLLMMASYAVLPLLYLALYAALRRASPSLMTIALASSFLSVAIYLGTNPAFAMLSLSDQYATAATEAQRSSLVAAGQAVFANSVGSAFNVSYILGAAAALIIAAVMLRSNIFGKATAYVGLLMGILMIVPATVGTFGLVLSLLSLAPTTIWLVLVALRLFQLGRGAVMEGAHRT